MVKRRVEDILPCTVCDKIKIKSGINREKGSLFHLDVLSDYHVSRFAQ